MKPLADHVIIFTKNADALTCMYVYMKNPYVDDV